jgi:hypothetical protein
LILIFNPTPETGWGVLLVANHLDESLCLANQKQGAAVISYLFTHFFSSYRLRKVAAAPFPPEPATHGAIIYAQPKLFS